MKVFLCILLLAVLTTACIYFPYKLVSSANASQQITLDRNHTFSWYRGDTLTLNGTYTLKNPSYFELHQSTSLKQAIFEAPQEGENTGFYWVRDFRMSGEWSISTGADIYSLESSTFTSTSNNYGKTIYIILGIFYGIIGWLCSLSLTTWLFVHLPDF